MRRSSTPVLVFCGGRPPDDIVLSNAYANCTRPALVMLISDANHETPLGEMITVVDLLRERRLARVYTHVRRSGEVTVAEIVESLGLSERTVYDDVGRLEDAGFLHRTEERRPARYDAVDIELTLTRGGESQTVTPELIEAVARSHDDADLELYLDRHGIGGLAVALEYATEYVEGTVNHRIMARELEIAPLEASIVLQALRPIAEE